jgi:hypothetical protein
MSPPDLVRFAGEMADLLWDDPGLDVDVEAVESLLVSCGVIQYRKPTPNELADAEWWGHEYGIGADDEKVGEFTPAMKEMRKAARAKPEPAA